MAPRQRLWLTARGTTIDGAAAGFAVFRNGTVSIKAILLGKYLPLFVEHLCNSAVNSRDDVIQAIKTEFKVRDIVVVSERQTAGPHIRGK
jgi:hypothetical protein